MELWISGRIDSDIDELFFRRVLAQTKQAVNAILVDKNYGTAIENWDVLMIIYREPTSPVIKYSAKNKDTDIEIPIDHGVFIEGDLNKGKKLFYDALIFSLKKLQSSKKVRDFDFVAAINDITELAARETF